MSSLGFGRLFGDHDGTANVPLFPQSPRGTQVYLPLPTPSTTGKERATGFNPGILGFRSAQRITTNHHGSGLNRTDMATRNGRITWAPLEGGVNSPSTNCSTSRALKLCIRFSRNCVCVFCFFGAPGPPLFDPKKAPSPPPSATVPPGMDPHPLGSACGDDPTLNATPVWRIACGKPRSEAVGREVGGSAGFWVMGKVSITSWKRSKILEPTTCKRVDERTGWDQVHQIFNATTLNTTQRLATTRVVVMLKFHAGGGHGLL